MSGYAAACFAALQDQGAEVLLAHRAATSDAPFDDSGLALDAETVRWSTRPDERSLRARIERFDARRAARVLVGRRRLPAHRPGDGRTDASGALHGQPVAGHAQAMGRPGRLAAWSSGPTCDAVFLPGDRQADFARRLGFPRTGSSGAPTPATTTAFAAVADARTGTAAGVRLRRPAASREGRRHAGRRPTAPTGRRPCDPWPLTVCGTGPHGRACSPAYPASRCVGSCSLPHLPEIYARYRMPGAAEPVRALGRRHPRGGRRRPGRGVHHGVRGVDPARARRLQRRGGARRNAAPLAGAMARVASPTDGSRPP